MTRPCAACGGALLGHERFCTRCGAPVEPPSPRRLPGPTWHWIVGAWLGVLAIVLALLGPRGSKARTEAGRATPPAGVLADERALRTGAAHLRESIERGRATEDSAELARADDEELSAFGHNLPPEEPAPDSILDRLDRMPRVLLRAPPEYPEEARRQGIEGMVVLRALVGRDGRVHRTRIVSSPGPLLAAAARASVRRWRFSPALHDSAPVATWVEVPVNFRLE